MDNKTVFKINKNSKISLEELHTFSKEELVQKIIRLRAHNSQLQNIIEKKSLKKLVNNISKRQFDFSKTYQRHVLLKFLYCGWDYQGFSSQEDTTATIEFHLFSALKKTCLIENRENSNYNRCGRTDKEVSAFCQVISINIRSKFPENEQLIEQNIQNEIEYCNILNRVLPKNIKCIAWMPLKNNSFSARFDCMERTYKYFFPKGDLDIEAMRLGCKYLIGLHDFRNLCKMDVGNGVVTFYRSIKSADIHMCGSQINKDSAYCMYYFKITGKAFLWHQIRCIMAILIAIGEGNEDPLIISELLDIQKNPCKPLYSLVKGLPLNLYNCEFYEKSSSNLDNLLTLDNDMVKDTAETIDENALTEWIFNKENLTRLIQCMQNEWSELCIKQTMIREMLNDLDIIYCKKWDQDNLNCQINFIKQGAKQKNYKKLMNRKRCESLENRLKYYVKKQRLITNENCK